MGSGLSNMTALRFVFSFYLPRPVNVCEDCGGARKRPPPAPTGVPGGYPTAICYTCPSTRDDYSCIWAQRPGGWTWQLEGCVQGPMGVYQFHETRCSLNMAAGASFSRAARGRIVFALAEQSGNIWLAEPGR
jgi:hypothetical protein